MIFVIVLISVMVFVICVAVVKKLFFTIPHQDLENAKVDAYENKAME